MNVRMIYVPSISNYPHSFQIASLPVDVARPSTNLSKLMVDLRAHKELLDSVKIVVGVIE